MREKGVKSSTTDLIRKQFTCLILEADYFHVEIQLNELFNKTSS